MPSAVDIVNSAFPWLKNLGLGDRILQWTQQGYNADTMLGLVRQTQQYKSMFEGITRDDGTMRMNESQYLANRDAYSTMLFNYTGQRITSSSQIAGLMENEVAPAEFEKRLQVLDTVKRDGAQVRSAFYIYAGIKLSDDDLYGYVVDPTKRSELDKSYSQQAASTKLTYDMFITRSTEVGIQNVTDQLANMRDQGIATDEAVRRMQSINPDMAKQMTDLLYHGGDPQGGSLLGLNQLQSALEYALLGSAATEQGFNLPTADRIAAFREAGITRAKALDAYGTFSSQMGKIQGETERVGHEFGQADWENAQFLRNGAAMATLGQAQAQEQALGSANNAGAISFDQQGRVVQRGLSNTSA